MDYLLVNTVHPFNGVDDTKVQTDSVKNATRRVKLCQRGRWGGQKSIAAPNHSWEGPGAAKTEHLKRKRLALALVGLVALLFLGALLVLRLGLVVGLVLRESEAGGAEDQRHAEH